MLSALFLIGAPSSVLADAPQQMHHGSGCADKDAACQKAWLVEYEPAILSEFKYWSDFKKDAIAGNKAAVSEDIYEAQRQMQYRHFSWDLVRSNFIEGVDYEHLEHLMMCRIAIIDMKYWLIGIGHDDYSQGASDRQNYEKDARECLRIEVHADDGAKKRRRVLMPSGPSNR